MPARQAGYTQELLRQMSVTVVPVEEPERIQARREQVVARLEVMHDELNERRRRVQRWTRRIAILAAAAAPLLAVGGYGLAKHDSRAAQVAVAAPAPAELSVENGSVLFSHGSAAERPVHASQRLAAGDRVHTGDDGRAGVRLRSGADVEMSPATELTLGAQVAGWHSESVELARGRVDVSVPVLPPGGSFAVLTPDARVEVHGTHFTVIVEPGPAGELMTRVGVRDGKVLVQSHGFRTLLGHGADWSSQKQAVSAKDAPAAAAATKSAAAPGVAAPDETARATHGSAKAPRVKSAGATRSPGVTSASSLAEQNRLFQAAMDARRGGDDRRALSLLNQLIGRYPGSPLEQDARVERFRALKRLGREGEATRAARRYLAEHPEGFARDEARQMALTPGPAGSK